MKKRIKLLESDVNRFLEGTGVKACFVRGDGDSLLSITLSSQDKFIDICKPESYGDYIRVFTEIDEEKADVFTLSGEAKTLNINEQFDSEQAANDRKHELEAQLDLPDDVLSITKESFLVPISDKPRKDIDEVPF